jgi:Polysaccharide lyase
VHAARRLAAIAAAFITACAFAGSAWAAQTCNYGLGRAGVLDETQVRAVRASLGPATAPDVQDGYATAWIGVGRNHWVRVGLRSGAGTSTSRLFYAVNKGDRSPTTTLLNRWVQPGERVSVAVRRWRWHPGWWRIFVNQRQVAPAIEIGGGLKLRPTASAEVWNTSAASCNRFSFDFRSVRIKRRIGIHWDGMPLKNVVQDPGYELVKRAAAAFVARSTEVDNGRFVGDWETGDRHQWDRIQYRTGGAIADQFSIVKDPVRQGSFAAKFVVRPGDVFNSGGERCEVVRYSFEGEGSDYWYSWSTLFPPDWTAPSFFGIFLQFHGGFPFSPPIAFDARNNTAQVNLNTGVVDPSTGHGTNWVSYPLLSTLAKGQWNDFVIHIHWSLTDGSLTVWHRTADRSSYKKLLDLNDVPTLQSDKGEVSKIYVKQGLYRWRDAAKTDYLYQDGFRRASSIDDLGFIEDPVTKELAAS